MISKMIDTLWLQVQKQGLAFSLIALLAYVFWLDNTNLKKHNENQFKEMQDQIKELNKKVDMCNENHLNSLVNELKTSTLVIEKNNELLTRMENKIRIMP